MTRQGVRAWLFVMVVVAAIAGVAGYVRWRTPTAALPESPALVDPADPASAARLDRLRQAPHIAFLSRSTETFDHVGLAAVRDPSDSILLATPACERSHFGANGGLCLELNQTSMQPRAFAVLVDRHFRPVGRLPLNGLPIRARVSPDHRRAAATVFVTGESYSATSRRGPR